MYIIARIYFGEANNKRSLVNLKVYTDQAVAF